MSESIPIIFTGKVCPYCGKESELIDSAEIYGISYGPIYICRDCDAYVGCYTGTTNALGMLANKELREAKKRAHHYLDQLWMPNRTKRYRTYTWLSKQLGIPREITHIGMSDVTKCNRIGEISIAKLKERGIEYQVWPGDIGKV
jgi:hypothetical protein